MLTNRRTIRIQFDDCDPDGIVFYPRCFEFFDACTDALFERAQQLFRMPQALRRKGAGRRGRRKTGVGRAHQAHSIPIQKPSHSAGDRRKVLRLPGPAASNRQSP